ncbi:MAG: molybdopterin-guanine dinucleotide biosynthesis protein B [Bacillota bacterium]
MTRGDNLIPIISVVGRSKSGKTTLLERLIPELAGRGYRVGTIKHDVHGFEVDQPGKDTWKHARAGAVSVAISSHAKVAVIRRLESEMPLDDVATLLGEVDIILTEGYKSGDKPKVEVLGLRDPSPLYGPGDNMVAQVGNGETIMGAPPYINRDDAASLADVIEKKFLLAGSG